MNDYYIVVSFLNNPKGYYFSVDNPSLKIGDKVIVETAIGKEVGIIKEDPKPINELNFDKEIKPILRKAIKNDLLKQIESNGLTYEQYKEMVGLTDDKLEANYFEEARRRIVEYLTIITIGREEKIALTDEDLEKYYSQIAEQYKMEVGKVKEIFAKNENKSKQSLIQNKIEQLILDNNIKTVAKKTTKKTKKEEATESVDEKKIAEEAKEEKAE